MTIPATLPDASRNASPMLYGPEADAVAHVLHSGQYGHTEVTEHFEHEIARFLGVPDAVAVASGTAALHIALLAAGIGPGDEVIVPSMTFCATVQAITACGAHPRFVDVDPATLCVTAGHMRDALTPATRAVVPVLYGGRTVNLSGIHTELAGRGIQVVQDAAHAFGSRAGAGRVGADQRATTCFSFGPIKNLTCGQGGMIIPRTPEEAETARTLRMLGVAQTAAERAAATSYTVAGFGLRYQMPAINAAIGRVQLAHFATAESVRKKLWAAYQAALAGLDGVTLVDVDAEQCVPSLCVVRVPARDRVFAFLRARGVGVGVHYPPNHLQPAFARWHRDLPVTEALGGQILTLPFHPHLTEQHVRHVAALLGQALAAGGRP
ncbi:DegT/DnrJ/EryC1/StrS aminotransferase family protein [Streptomyces albus]|uniref:DegT/DnrJ/EryC1/StrS family aminotransferase n=1 Tax=Streptomyces albus TaxID=1888 RepID=UPI0004C707FA|nr:DegT/DnrJ/EryC1/StrS family aminotransferase [Streptomyces albus]